MNTDKLYLWNTVYNDQTDRHIVIKNMSKNTSEYNYLDNARSLSRLIMYCLPGNTLDLILSKIEDQIKSIARNCPDVLNDDFYISNIIRNVLNDIANLE